MEIRTTISLASSVLTFCLLLLSYFKTGATRNDFGNVPQNLHVYMLVMAAVATVCLWILLVRVYTTDKDDDGRFGVYASVYFVLQLGFIPSVRWANRGNSKVPMQFLLLLCTIPMALLFGSVRDDDAVGWALAGFVFFHVVVNDAILYGYLF